MVATKLKLHAAAILLFLVTGCATLQDPVRSNLAAPSVEVAQCAAWYRTLDTRIDQAKVRDAGPWRIPGYPYLRADRYTASFRNQVTVDDAKFQAWTLRLRALDTEARAVELRNLPEASLGALGVTREQAGERSSTCAEVLARHDLADTAQRAQLAARVQVPDDYLTWQRALGLYPVTRIPFFSGIENWHEDAVEDFRKSPEVGLATGTVSRYMPAGAADRAAAAAAVMDAPKDILGIPQFTAAQLDTLFLAYAPVIEVQTTGAFDRIGALGWGAAPGPEVDSSTPVVYRKLAFTRLGETTLPQLVYLAWFSERPHSGGIDLLAGRLDGIVWRVTLDRAGEPLLYDTMHPCGCFHMFFPTPRVEPVPVPETMIEWAFTPAPAPQLAAGERMVIRLATRTHYMVGIGAASGGDGSTYTFADYDALRMLPLAGGTRSAFRPDGMVPGTERGERAFFWPMGVPSAGAMRQWGHHATAFVGRRHFDDADLIERRFRLPQQ
ncbi:MAG TPA: hypothetical protein VJT81_12370 [Burkholderiales bacterium]|nr:hypothetical protein [Burkholderiales bacterium]